MRIGMLRRDRSVPVLRVGTLASRSSPLAICRLCGRWRSGRGRPADWRNQECANLCRGAGRVGFTVRAYELDASAAELHQRPCPRPGGDQWCSHLLVPDNTKTAVIDCAKMRATRPSLHLGLDRVESVVEKINSISVAGCMESGFVVTLVMA